MAKVISSLPGSTGTLSRTSQLTNDGESGVSTYVELDDISTVATTGDYNNLINVPIDFTPKVHTHNISDISGTKSEFNTSLTDGDFLFVGDVISYTNEEAQDAVGSILTDSTTIDFTYDDTTPTISANVKLNSIDATHLADGINITEFTNNANYETTSQLNIRDTNNRNRVNHTGEQPISTVTGLQTNLDLKQDNLVSGTTIKTIEGQSILGSGNIDITKSDVGLPLADNTSDASKSVLSSTKLTTPRSINGVNFDGTSNITINAVDSTPRIAVSEKAQANGIATLGSDGKVPNSQIPALAITDTFVVASQAEQLALVAEVGDVAVRTDLNKSFILRVTGASTLANWQELLTPVSVDQTIIDGSTNAVSGNAVFDALATKAPISSVHNPVTLGMANGLSLSTQQLSLGLASSGVTGALSGTDWNNFNNKQNALAIVSDAEMQTGTENTKPITALRNKTWFTWRLTQPFTFGNLAGTGNRVVQVNSSGDTSAPYNIQDGFTTDSDVITALTAATYNSGNNYTATITPANSKVFNQGQFYKNAGVLYFATADNQVSRITLS